MNSHRDFLLVMTLAATAVTTVFGQSVAPTVGSADSGKGNGASIPDLSGKWLHPSIPGFEPLSSGPTSVVNRSRRNGTGDINQLVGDYTNPILKPEAAEVVEKARRNHVDRRRLSGPAQSVSGRKGCLTFLASGGMQLLQQRDKVTFLYDYDHQVRHVRMNQPHPAQVTPSWYGDSVGHYEGDTLVIDTVGFKVGSLCHGRQVWHATHLGSARRRKISASRLRRRERRHGTGRYTRIKLPWGPGTRPSGASTCSSNSRSRMKGVFTMPWSATITYGRPLIEWPEFVCAENTQWFPGTEAAIPTAEKPDF